MVSETTLTTYSLADGELIFGEYSFVTTDDFFDDIDEPTEIIKQVWVLRSEERLLRPLCGQCGNSQAVYWGLCQPCAALDDPEFFGEE